MAVLAAEDLEVRAAQEAQEAGPEVKVEGLVVPVARVAGPAGAMAGAEDVEDAGAMGLQISRTGSCRSGASPRSSRVAAGSTSAP